MAENYTNNKKIIKNTSFLYLRTAISMVISLYTSRVFLEVLGVENLGIYNVIGGTVGMLSILTGSLSGACSRFISISLGEGNKEKLMDVFSTCVTIITIITGGIVAIGEFVGILMLNSNLNIPPDRMYAAHWVLQCSILSFALGLLMIPYNSCIIAHERMNIFAYMSILEVVLKLVNVYIVSVIPIDKLIAYSILVIITSLILRIIYGIYCVENFQECKVKFFKFQFNKDILYRMIGFSGWSLMGTSAYLFSTQGVNILMNIFFGVTLNAARAIALQVEGAVTRFVNDFMTALNPQIIKSYASGDKTYMFLLVCNGAKYSYFLMLIFLIPIEFEADTVLSLWLTEVPEYSVIFLRLTLISTTVTLLGNTSLTAIFAIGRIRNYEFVAFIVASSVFVLTWIAYKMGFPPFIAYIIYIILYILLNVFRLLFMKKLLDIRIRDYIKNVIVPSILVTIVVTLVSAIVHNILLNPVYRLFVVTIVCFITTSISIYFLGLNSHERAIALNFIIKYWTKLKRKRI